MTAARPYSRVYFEIVDHPRFERVYSNPHALGVWLQMLLTADAMHPMPAPMPPRNPTVRLLIDVGLVIERPGNRYSMRGLSEERERRSDAARNAAAVRWQNGRSAETMPRRDEHRKDETSNGANAPEHRPFMGFAPRPAPSTVDVQRQLDEAWQACADCGVLGRKHPASGDHPFRAAAGVGR
jgi:hypothetical protein